MRLACAAALIALGLAASACQPAADERGPPPRVEPEPAPATDVRSERDGEPPEVPEPDDDDEPSIAAGAATPSPFLAGGVRLVAVDARTLQPVVGAKAYFTPWSSVDFPGSLARPGGAWRPPDAAVAARSDHLVSLGGGGGRGDWFRVETPGHAMAFILAYSDSSDPIHVRVLPGASIRGVVEWDGAAMPYIGVLAVQRGWDVDRLRLAQELERGRGALPRSVGIAGAVSAPVDRGGAFVIDGLRDGGEYHVFAVAATGPRSEEVVATAGAGADVRLRLERRSTIRVHGATRDAWIVVDGERVTEWVDSKRTWVARGLSPGRHTVLNRTKGCVVDAEVVVAAGASCHVDLPFASWTMRGTVVGDDGQPARGARVEATTFAFGRTMATVDGPVALSSWRVTDTGEDGSFELPDLPRCEHDVFVAAAGFEPVVAWRCGPEGGAVRIRLGARATRRLVRVRDTTGAPLDGRSGWIQWTPIRDGDVVQVPLRGPSARWSAAAVRDGVLALDRLATGRCSVEIEMSGFRRAAFDVTVAGPEVTPGEFVLYRLRTANVVARVDGKPAAFADVFAMVPGASAAEWVAVGRTWRDGTLELTRLSCARATLRVEYLGKLAGFANWDGTDGATVSVNLRPAGSLLISRVGADGADGAGGAGGIRVEGPLDDPERSATWEPSLDIARSAAELLPAGTYRVSTAGSSPVDVPVRAGERVEAVMRGR